MERIEKIRIELIDDNPYQTRTVFVDYSEDIKLNGLNNPIVVRPIGDRYQLLAGENRLRSVKKNQSLDIDCRIVKKNDFEAELYSFRDNEIRETLNPVDRAVAIHNIFLNLSINSPALLGNSGKMTTFQRMQNREVETELNDGNDSGSNFSGEETGAVNGEEGIPNNVHDSCTDLIKSLQNVYSNINRNKDYDKELKSLCDKIGLSITKIIDSLNILTLPKELIDKSTQTQEALNAVVKVLKDTKTKYQEAKDREDRVNDPHNMESNQLKNIYDKVESYIIEKNKTCIDSSTLMMICNAIINTPTDSKLEIIKSDHDEKNRSIANMINLINDNDNVTQEDKEDLMLQLIHNFAIDGIKNMKLFLEYFSKIDYDLKEAVINGLNIKAAHLIWGIRDINERKELIDSVIGQAPNIQVIKVNKYIKTKEEEAARKIREEQIRREEEAEEARIKAERIREAEFRAAEKEKRIQEAIFKEARRAEQKRKQEVEAKKIQDELEAKLEVAAEEEKLRLEKEAEDLKAKLIEEEKQRKIDEQNRHLKEIEDEKQRKIDEEQRLIREAEEDKRREQIRKEREAEIYKEAVRVQKDKLINYMKKSASFNVDLINTYPNEYREEIIKVIENTITELSDKLRLVI